MLSLRKVGISVLVVDLIIGLIGFTVLPGAKTVKPILLRMAYPSADQGFAYKMIKWWGSNVEKRSGEKIIVEYY